MKKASLILFIVIIALIFAFFSIGPFFANGGEYSNTENRLMATKPELNTGFLTNDNFSDDYEAWLKDNVFEREQLIKLYTWNNLTLLSKPVVNDVYENDNVILPFLSESKTVDKNNLDTIVDGLSKLNKSVISYGGKFTYIGINGQISQFNSEYPAWLNNYNSYFSQLSNDFPNSLENEGIDFISGTAILSNDDYFKTDHHISLNGAYKLYKQICKISNVTPFDQNKLKFIDINNTFLGSRNRRLYGFSTIKENLNYFELPTDIPFTRTENGESVINYIFKIPETSNEPVTYDMYMGGDIPLCCIDTKRDDLPNVLIFGDSYTNIVECFTWLSFNKMYSIDLRYDTISLIDFINETKPDYVFCIRDDGSWLETSGNGNIY